MATASEVCKALNEVEAALEMLRSYQPHLLYRIGHGDSDYLAQMLTTTDRLRTALGLLAAIVVEESPR